MRERKRLYNTNGLWATSSEVSFPMELRGFLRHFWHGIALFGGVAGLMVGCARPSTNQPTAESSASPAAG
ncbi:MAG TPA: hypothetical protein V6C65_00700, partial [Allocoleopsis sp.]